jgi:hypothetical protein
MAKWTFRCYDDGRSPDLWRRWFDSHPECQAKHDSVLDILEQRDVWTEPYVKTLRAGGLVEIRIVGGVQWRIFGYYSGLKSFTVVATGNHKGSVYSPRDILKTASKIIRDIKSGEKGSIPCVRPESP